MAEALATEKVVRIGGATASFSDTEASWVSRRLLFVRRSHDECYEEQVFA